jgi:hypothetical protein
MAALLALGGCAAPSLRPLTGPESLVQDAGLVGEWVTEGPTVARVVVTEGEDGRYLGALTIHHKGEFKTALELEISLTQIGEDRFIDLYLTKRNRQALAAQYGFLALPVHQFMMLERAEDVLRVWTFDSEWIRPAAAERACASEVLPIAGRDIAVITADADELAAFLREHAHDPGSLSPPMVLHRVRP